MLPAVKMKPLILFTTILLSSLTFARTVVQPVDYNKAVCRGGKLNTAMRQPASQNSQLISPVQSPWDGTLLPDLSAWGYFERKSDDACNLAEAWQMGPALTALGVSDKSTANGGQNQCYEITHGDLTIGVPVEEQTYRVNGKRYTPTGATTIIGINPEAGFIFFLMTESPAEAFEMFSDRPARDDELPELRAQSDYAWGFWNRLMAHNLGGINALWRTHVMNKDTRAIIRQVFRTYTPPPGVERVNEPQVWPGTDFSTSTEEGLALLGSPNGIAPGFFLAQHKEQFGRNLMIERVTVYLNSPFISAPTMVYWVKEAPAVKRRAASPHTNNIEINMPMQNLTAGVIEKLEQLKNLGSRGDMDMIRVHVTRL